LGLNPDERPSEPLVGGDKLVTESKNVHHSPSGSRWARFVSPPGFSIKTKSPYIRNSLRLYVKEVGRPGPEEV
jgi:hypothetical protein